MLSLLVPAFSVSAYKLDDNWYRFNKIVAIEGDLTDVTINRPFNIVDYAGLAANANLTLATGGHLTVSGNAPLSLGRFVQSQSLRSDCSTLIANSEIRAGSVTTGQGSSRVKALSAADRALFNFVLAGETYSDRARLVVNEAYTLSLNATVADYDVLLTDRETGVTTNLAEKSYSFEAFAQTANGRFTVKLVARDEQTAIGGVTAPEAGFMLSGNRLQVAAGAAIAVHTVDGKLIYSGTPDGPNPYRKLTLLASPRAGGTVRVDGRLSQVAVGQSVSCYASENSYYDFVHWLRDGAVVSTNSRYSFTMPDEDVELTAVFELNYNPTSPDDPQESKPAHRVTLTASPGRVPRCRVFSRARRSLMR